MLEFYKKHEKEFITWLKEKRRISEGTAKDYISAINRYLPRGIKEPKQLPIETKAFSKGLRNFLNFLEEEYYMTELNGFSFDLWRKHLQIRPKEKRKKEIFLTDDDIREAYNLIKKKWEDETTTTLFKLVVYSGIRLEHAVELLRTFDKRKLILQDKVALYPIESFAKGKKRGYFAFMPADFARKLEKPKNVLTYKAYTNRLTPERWKPKEDNPVSPVRIRSWFQNFAIGKGVTTEALRFIVGHSPRTVGEAHYYNMKKIATEQYEKIVDRFPL